MGIRIQFVGLVGSGKSYLSHLLAKEKDGNIIPFAKKVYELAAIVKGSTIDKTLPQDRELLKLIGTTWGRESKELSPEMQNILELYKPQQWGTQDIWAETFIADCQNVSKNVSIFNDDTRFENELRIAGTMGEFIPVFVACTEETRRARLYSRGDKNDPNDPNHQSEMLVNRLYNSVLEKNLMTVVWNDIKASKPDQTWIIDKDTFISLASTCENNEELGKELNWNQQRLHELINYAKQEQGRIYV
jgi:hypothetical protein